MRIIGTRWRMRSDLCGVVDSMNVFDEIDNHIWPFSKAPFLPDLLHFLMYMNGND
jgi:hypothetical protein